MKIIKNTNGYKVEVKKPTIKDNAIALEVVVTDFVITNKDSAKKRAETHSKYALANPNCFIEITPCFARLTLDCSVDKIECVEEWHERTRETEPDSETVAD